jgi:hypothetical protein
MRGSAARDGAFVLAPPPGSARMLLVTVAATGRGAVREGRRRAERQRHPERRVPVLLLGLGAVASGAAWVFLVNAAIDFGRLARGGDETAWLFTAAATIGAIVCLLLLFVLGARVLSALGLVSEYKPRRSSGRRAK